MKKNLILLTALLCWAQLLLGQDIVPLRGKVLSKEDGSPLPGALVVLGDSKKMAIADEEGIFELAAPEGLYSLKVSYLGMLALELEVVVPHAEELVLLMEPDVQSLHGVTVMSTGYQDLPAERVTGSFVALDRDLVGRRVSTSLVDRLEDVTPGLILNRGPNTGRDQISIRGRSTLFANTAPLIIVDNFPYDGPLESINPNDIEQITVLKDAAAASIWGARAGNGVIVVTTRSGTRGSAPRVSFNSNVNLFEETDPFYLPQMNMGDFVDIQKRLFESNFYRSQEISPSKPALPQVVETLIAERDGRITAEESERRLKGFKGNDLRSELLRYYYRPRINQQYALQVSGGGAANTYLFSLGYDDNLHEIEGNGDSRWTLQGKNSWNFLDDRLTWTAGIYLSKAKGITGTQVPQDDPYTRLADDSGNALPIYFTVSQRYVESMASSGLLDWNRYPLEEIGTLDMMDEGLDARFQTGLSFRVLEGLQAEASYQYWTNRGRDRALNPQSSFYVRDMINRFSQIEDGVVTRPLPLGDILDLAESDAYSHTLRGMLTYRKNWEGKHQLSLIAGTEIRDLQSESNSMRYYGYNDQLGTSKAVDFLTRFPYVYNPSLSATLESNQSHSGFADRFVSFYGNGGYTFRNKLDLTASIRKDQSNFFGLDANRRGVPLWSVGAGWTLSEERFAGFLKGAYLKWKASYGYSGNLDKSLSAEMTASYFNMSSFALLPNIPAAHISNPPNPNLSWEKVAIWNTGIDFESATGKYRVSLEAYRKKGVDLVGRYDAMFSSGFLSITSNYASTQTSGLDLVLGADWLPGKLKWRTDFFYSRVSDEVTQVDIDYSASALAASVYNANAIPVVGNPIFSVYSYPWAGLNPDTGSPRGLLDGEPSENYSAILSTASLENMVYHGPARPTDFGAMRNTLQWRGFSLSANVSYRFGYYYRRRSVNYFALLRGQIGHGDYERRWMEPGDEEFTQIPTLPASANSQQNTFYSNSAVLVEKGDHIRLQDIRLGYGMEKDRMPWLPFARIELYGYANNLGILWKASDDVLDPDFQTSKPLRSFAFGLRMDF
jgi:TonB-linked SusC/RagA family outer membrane protein